MMERALAGAAADPASAAAAAAMSTSFFMTNFLCWPGAILAWAFDNGRLLNAGVLFARGWWCPPRRWFTGHCRTLFGMLGCVIWITKRDRSHGRGDHGRNRRH